MSLSIPQKKGIHGTSPRGLLPMGLPLPHSVSVRDYNSREMISLSFAGPQMDECALPASDFCHNGNLITGLASVIEYCQMIKCREKGGRMKALQFYTNKLNRIWSEGT